jgi:hypothetical protein
MSKKHSGKSTTSRSASDKTADTTADTTASAKSSGPDQIKRAPRAEQPSHVNAKATTGNRHSAAKSSLPLRRGQRG